MNNLVLKVKIFEKLKDEFIWLLTNWKLIDLVSTTGNLPEWLYEISVYKKSISVLNVKILIDERESSFPSDESKYSLLYLSSSWILKFCDKKVSNIE